MNEVMNPDPQMAGWYLHQLERISRQGAKAQS